MKVNLANKVWSEKKPYILFHTHVLNEDVLQQAISQQKNVDIDISVDPEGKVYVGHSYDYHQRTKKPLYDSVDFEEAISTLSESDCYCYVDCKQRESLGYIFDIVERLGGSRCHIISFVHELNFYSSAEEWKNECIVSEWIEAEDLLNLKDQFPDVSIAGSGKGLSLDQVTTQPDEMADNVRERVPGFDAVSLNIKPRNQYPSEFIIALNKVGLLPHVPIDTLGNLPEGLFIGETDHISRASCA